jgi:two-component system, LytTR family, response regulator
MEKIKVIIADDDFPSRYILSQFVQLLPEFEVVGESTNGLELIHLVLKEKPDLVLVDINMPHLNGVEAVKSCKEFFPGLHFIFTTGSDAFAVEAFNLSAIDYILKPIEKTRLFVALEKFKKTIQLQIKQVENVSRKNKHKLSIKTNNTFLYLSLEDMFFIEKEGRKSILHTATDRFETSESLQDLEGRLPDFFYKSHRSYLVNLRKIEKIVSFGESYQAYFSATDKVAHISKLKINEVYGLMES